MVINQLKGFPGDLGATFEGYFHGFHGYFHGPGSPVYLVQKGQDGAHAVQLTPLERSFSVWKRVQSDKRQSMKLGTRRAYVSFCFNWVVQVPQTV